MVTGFRQRLFSPVDARPLEVFRVVFGVVLVLQVYSYWKSDFIAQGILAPVMHFHFDLFPFVGPLPAGGLKAVLALTFVAPVLMALNRFFRTATAVYLVCFGYLFLLEESYYNNHFYFILLLCGFFLFYRPREAGGRKVIPCWLLLLFRFQVFVVYFYGGIAKLNADWLLYQQPVRELLAANAGASPFPAFASSAFAVYYIAYGGLVFDLVIGFMLFFRRTFPLAVVLTVIFHVTNFWIFNFGEGGTIGIFPILMIGANILFAAPESLDRLIRRVRPGRAQQPKKQGSPAAPFPSPAWALPVLGAFVAVQLLLPLRHLMVPENSDWTGQQQWFSWRMKVSAKRVHALFILQRFEGDEPATVDPARLINSMQMNMMGQHADMIYKFVQYLKHDLRERMGIRQAIIRADIRVAFNGRPARPFVDPDADLFGVTYRPMGRNDWILDMPDDPPGR